MRISVAIATYGRPTLLGRAMRSVIDSGTKPMELLVVDGDPAGSSKAVANDLAVEAPFPIRWIGCQPGLTRQRNVALDAATGEIVVFIDDDARLEPDAIERLAAAYEAPGVVGATGRVVEPASNRVAGKTSRVRDWLPGGGQEGGFTRYGYPRRLVREDVSRDVEFMAGCFMSARTAVARQVRFDERLPGYGLAEDEDFGCRLARNGRVRYVADAVVRHDNLGAGSRDGRRFSKDVVVNRHHLFRKNFDPTLRARAEFWMLVVLLVLHRLVNRDVPGVRGVVDGVVAVLTRRGVADR